MYYPGQIVYDLDARCPVQIQDPWAVGEFRRTIHFLESDFPSQYSIALPETVAEAERLLAEGRIAPAPIPSTHCPICMNWIENCKVFHCREGR